MRRTICAIALVLGVSVTSIAAAETKQSEAWICWSKFLLETALCNQIATEATYVCLAAMGPNAPDAIREQCEQNPGYQCFDRAARRLFFCLPWNVSVQIEGLGEVTITGTINRDN
ncbi:MAG: hypothetical protein KDD44_13715 [Bdellovibrionales bacterium]|nr:hypothetical protein [Bdellovibrionales bacterium]